MAKLEWYNDLTKFQEDLVKKGFCFGQAFAITTYCKAPSLNLLYKASFKQLLDSEHSSYTASSTSFTYNSSPYSYTQTLSTDKSFKNSFSYTPEWNKSLKFLADLNHSKLQNTSTFKLSCEYTSKYIKSHLSLENLKSVNIQATSQYKQCGLGVDLTINSEHKRLSKYDMGFWWFRDDYRLVIKHLSNSPKQYKFGHILGSLYYKVSKDFDLAGQVVYEKLNGGCQSSVAGRLRVDDGKELKGRLDDTGMLGISLRNKVGDMVTLITAGQANILDSQLHFQVGFRIKINQ
ncbi:hypothetical protein SteCoe_25695 [Stentor coeruleus]|uniref:Uncharacterized protein n=1 Tax=Stentor coeruleus TaxID=5963 RepID=A0A1R2BEL4_9CILI|nr:hypothetical protein SteCoe_25695 [Stentor coeruleus]